MQLTQMLVLLLELLLLLLLLLHLFLPLFLQWFKQLQQQKQQQLQKQQHLCLNEKLILIQFNFISIDFVFVNFFKVNLQVGAARIAFFAIFRPFENCRDVFVKKENQLK